MRWVLLLGLLGCSNSTPATDGGSDAQTESASEAGSGDASADAKVVPRAAVKAVFNPADAGCTGSIFTMGTLPDGLVDDGAMGTVACSVRPNGQKFDVTLTVNAMGSPSGMDLAGSFATSGTQTLDVMLRDSTGMPVMKMMCAGTYPMNGGVSAGKVWIKLACMPSIDPGPSGCAVEVEARAENCSQK